jgi:predicted dienelactone hydrolase
MNRKNTAKCLSTCATLIVSFGLPRYSVQADAHSAFDGSKIVYQDWKDDQRERTIPVKIYLPETGMAPFPVVIFSHGLGGSREAAVYLGDYWSQHGYLCVFVQHPGSDSGVWQSVRGAGKAAIMQSMKKAANGQNLIDRANDVKFVIDELEKRNQSDPLLRNQLDLSKIGIAGHSFGAGTSLAIAGQRFAGTRANLKDQRVKAAIYLCPPVMGGKLAREQFYGTIKIPGLLLTGTEDNSPIGETRAEDRRIPFDGISSPHQYLANFIGANHATFGGASFSGAESNSQFHEMIDRLSTEFLDAALKGDPNAWRWLDSDAASYLGKSAVYEKK